MTFPSKHRYMRDWINNCHKNGLVRIMISHAKLRGFSTQDAEDLTQNTLAIAKEKSDDSKRYSLGFFYKIIDFQCCNASRREKYRRMLLEKLAVFSTASTQATAEQATIARNVLEALDADVRIALFLVHFEGFSEDEAASALDVTRSVIRTRIQRAREELNACILRDISSK